MRITRVINNNVVCVVNERNQDRILLGSGIGFQKKKGDMVEKSKIEKEFFLKSKSVSGKLFSLLTQIPMEYMRVTDNIIKYAKESLDEELSENIYLTLTDHISFSVARQEKGLPFSNALLWEIKRFYPKEFKIGLHALELLNEEFNISLPEDEAASIAMHIVNAQLGSEAIRDTIQVTEVIQNILSLIRYHFKTDLNEESLYYSRFLTHLKFFAYRILNDNINEVGDEDFEEVVRIRYPEAYECASKIATSTSAKYNKNLSSDELVYLTVHIKRITTS